MPSKCRPRTPTGSSPRGRTSATTWRPSRATSTACIPSHAAACSVLTTGCRPDGALTGGRLRGSWWVVSVGAAAGGVATGVLRAPPTEHARQGHPAHHRSAHQRGQQRQTGQPFHDTHLLLIEDSRTTMGSYYAAIVESIGCDRFHGGAPRARPPPTPACSPRPPTGPAPRTALTRRRSRRPGRTPRPSC